VTAYYGDGLFPIAHASDNHDLRYEVRWHFDPSGPTVQDMNWTWRNGEFARIWLFALDRSSAVPVNRLAWILALLALLWSCWLAGERLLGIGLVVAFGAHPFQHYAAYVDGDVWSFMLTTCVLVLAACVPLLVRGPRRWPAVALAALFGLLSTLRTEPLVLALPAVLVLVARGGWRALLITLAVALLVRGGIDLYFSAKRTASARVANFPQTHVRWSHPIWHEVYLGLHHTWDDRVAFTAAEDAWRRAGREVPEREPSEYFYRTAFWDPARAYAVLPDELDGYDEALRDIIVDEVRADPWAYFHLFDDRARELLFAGPGVPGWVAIPVWIICALRRRWAYLAVCLIPVATSIPAVLLSTTNGLQFYNCFGAVGLAVLAPALLPARAVAPQEPLQARNAFRRSSSRTGLER